jgi:DHA2 family multidrug resistance protein
MQGVGTGFAYVPIAAISFATLAPHLRYEGTAIFNLLRNVGSSIGIAVMQALLTRNTQMMHARLAEHIVPYGGELASKSGYDFGTAHGLAALNASVTRQAAMIAYNNDFKLLLVLTLAVIPLLVVLRSGRPSAAAPVAAE